MDESQNRIELGTQAAHILENDAFKTACLSLRNQYVDSWMQAKTPEAREDCHKRTAALSDLLLDLKSMLTTGMLTRQRIDALQATRPRSWSDALNG